MSEENIKLYDEIKGYRALTDETAKKEKLVHIKRTYMETSSIHEVNMAHNTRIKASRVIERVENGLDVSETEINEAIAILEEVTTKNLMDSYSVSLFIALLTFEAFFKVSTL
jgi:hypothetical protein